MRGWRPACAAALSLLCAATIAPAAGVGVAAKAITVHSTTEQLPIATCRLTASADAFIDEVSALLFTNFGTGTHLEVQSLALADRRSFVRFALETCAIPSSATVVSARLRLTLTDAPSAGRTYAAHRITSSWTETGVTWYAQPSVDTTATATTSTGTVAGAVLEWDVATDVAAAVSGAATHHGWRLRDTSEDAILAIGSRFAAREHATEAARPALVVRYRR